MVFESSNECKRLASLLKDFCFERNRRTRITNSLILSASGCDIVTDKLEGVFWEKSLKETILVLEAYLLLSSSEGKMQVSDFSAYYRYYDYGR